ncbi:MAG: hypothetical protein HZA89_18595 [Verrucomicrobia bacterium]|nr:hypothetical protein [Verrucomicrobiota bacterium]
MPTQLTVDDARQSLNTHVEAKGREVFEKYGPHLGWNELVRLLQDRSCVRYPCEIVFDASVLQPGESAYPVAKGENPEEGFALCIHPYFAMQPARVPWLALYQLVLVNYGDFATSDDAETFGAAALGISKDDYYRALCEMTDELTASA